MAAGRFTAEEAADIVLNTPSDGDESELSDFEGFEGDEGDVTFNDQDEMDETSNESEEETENDMEDNPLVTRGDCLWGPKDEQTVHQYPEYTGNHGPTQLLGIDANPVDFFDLLFPDQLWTLIVQETNKYRFQRGVSQWDNDTSVEEIRAFIGILFGMGLHKVPEMKHYFSADWVLGVPAFAQVFTSKRWHQLWNYLHLADNDDPTRPRKATNTNSNQEQSTSGLKRELPCSDDQRDTKRRRDTEDPLKEYQRVLRSFYASMSKVQVIPAVPAFDIDDICTQLSSFVDESKPSGVTKKKLEYYTDIFKSREHCQEPKRILVYGRPGIGKTVFTQKTTFDWSQKRKEMLSTFDLVLLVKLHEVCDLPDVPAILKASEVFAIDSKISDDLYEYICHNEGKIKVLLILDGFDKYSAAKQSPILDIWKRKLLGDCCVIITTSNLTDDLGSHSDCEFEISGFDTDDQIRTFAKKFLSDEIKVEELEGTPPRGHGKDTAIARDALRKLGEKHREIVITGTHLHSFY